MARVPPELVEEVRVRTDIVEIVSEHVTLRKAGRSFTGLCPFHTEKTPSFAVDPQKQLYHCFGCGAGGNVFGFLMALEGLSFPEALRSLAKRAGVALPERREAVDRLQPLYDALRKAVELYRKELLHPARGEPARAYLAGRGLTEEVLEAFAVGWAPPQWEFLIRSLRPAGIGESVLEQAGLAVGRQSGKGRYDRFRQRVMFPVFTVSGVPVGFGGRFLPTGEEGSAADEGQPKYVNTPETPIYSKGLLLYGLHRARDAIRREQSAIVVEGYTDVLRLHQEGFANTVASSGTALTVQQARALVRYSPTVTVIMDGDDPGIQAARRAMGELLSAGADARVVLLPAEHDPDSYLREKGAESLAGLIEAARDPIAFETSLAGAVRDLDARSRLALARRVATHLVRIDDALKRDVMVREAARAVNVGPDALASEVRRLEREGGRVEGAPATTDQHGTLTAGARSKPGELDRELVRAMLMKAEARALLSGEIRTGEIADATLGLIASELAQLASVKSESAVAEVLQRLPEPVIQSLIVALHEDPAPVEKAEQLLSKLLARRARSEIRKLKAALPSASGDERRRLLELVQIHTRLISASRDERQCLLEQLKGVRKPTPTQ
jgi:DNA primase